VTPDSGEHLFFQRQLAARLQQATVTCSLAGGRIMHRRHARPVLPWQPALRQGAGTLDNVQLAAAAAVRKQLIV